MTGAFAPETPVKGGITLDDPGFAIPADCDRLERYSPECSRALRFQLPEKFVIQLQQGRLRVALKVIHL